MPGVSNVSRTEMKGLQAEWRYPQQSDRRVWNRICQLYIHSPSAPHRCRTPSVAHPSLAHTCVLSSRTWLHACVSVSVSHFPVQIWTACGFAALLYKRSPCGIIDHRHTIGHTNPAIALLLPKRLEPCVATGSATRERSGDVNNGAATDKVWYDGLGQLLS